MPDTRPSTITIDQYDEICERARTADEQLDKYWQYACEIARNIELLVAKGARLPARDNPAINGRNVARIIRAAHAVAQTAQP